MKLIECYVENFGGLSDFKITFSGGLNSIKEDNGYGKTTLTVFIKAMLFGLDDTRSKKLELNERKHYMPWQGGRCGGSLTFEANGRIYRIERTFMPKASDDTFKLYDSKSGNESCDFSKNIGEELFGIDADGFERTVFLSEANLSGKNENKTVSAKLSDLVGYDGDLSVMDEAIELLEKERKVYYKRGGSGEIGELKAAVSAVERRINDLERLTADYEKEKIRNAEISKELANVKETKNDYLKKSKIAEQTRLKDAYVKQYRQMHSSLENDRARASELEKFFTNGIPSHEEIDQAREMHLEAKRLSEKDGYSASPEFTVLSDFFKSEIPDEEYARARVVLSALESKKTELRLLKDDSSDEFSASSKGPSTSLQKWGMLFIIGLLLTVTPIALAAIIHPFALLVCPVGLIISIAALSIKARNKKYDAQYKESAALLNRIEALDSQIKDLEAEAVAFISHFPLENGNGIADALREIFKKRDIYMILENSQKSILEKSRNNSVLQKKYYESSTAFLSRFQTSSEKPFDEIKTKLMEYEALTASIQRNTAVIERFALEHNITADNLNDSDGAALLAMNFDYSELDSRIAMLEREKAVSERKLSEMFEEIDRIDEFTLEKERLTEEVEKLNKRLWVIQKTKSYLSEAKDLLTSKYLAKTKSAFDKYIDAVSKESRELFSMNTSFEIMKNERGTLRDAEAYSRGTRDLYALAARLALIDSLYENESPFIILDDPFAHFDDEKLKNALSLLRSISKSRQIIYITCTESRNV